jgi:ribosomal protein L37AE/L43A
LQTQEIRFRLAEKPPEFSEQGRALPCCPECRNRLLDIEQHNRLVFICESCGLAWPTMALAFEGSLRKAARQWIPPQCVRVADPRRHQDYMRHRKRRLTYAHAYYAAYWTTIRKKKRRHREANREKIADYQRRYREANREKVAEKQRRYREANRESQENK